MLDLRPDSTANKYRRARVTLLNEMIAAVLKSKPRCRILDIGGTNNFWYTWRDLIDWSVVEVTCVNHNLNHYSSGDQLVTMVEGDARRLDDIADNSFDIAFSNSVIEHVGRWADMAAMAETVQRVAPRYLVQTPYFWFPIEPHARTPLLHWIPESLAYRIVMARKCGSWEKRDTVGDAVMAIQSNKMLDLRQMQTLFPDAEIRRERAFGLVKSMIAVREPTDIRDND
jgi:hypothetical protein